MELASTNIGKIYCKWNDEIDDYDKYRIIKNDEVDNKKGIWISKNKDIETETFYSLEDFSEFKKDCVLLRSDGVMSCTNIVATTANGKDIKDVLLIFFPNNKVTGVPDIKEPHVIARQGVENLFASLAGEIGQVGMSVNLNNMPAGYAISDFMLNDRVLSSQLCHVYKTDSPDDIANIIDNKESDEIIKSLYDSHIQYIKNTNASYQEYTDKDSEYKCIDGFCNSLKSFIKNIGFMQDVYDDLHIAFFDGELKENKSLTEDDKLTMSVLYGGIHIDKAIPLKFDYDINLSAIKMKYILVMDNTFTLYIVPYTESPDEIDAEAVYKMNEERVATVQERLKKCANAYKVGNGQKSEG